MNRLTPTLLAAATGYLAGSIPSADIATRLARTNVDDLRATGSGNPGALNAAAVLGRRWGAAVLGADMAKGAAAVSATTIDVSDVAPWRRIADMYRGR